jgi:hypothetical protein
MNTSQQQQLRDWRAGIVTHARSACRVIRPVGTTDEFPTVQQSKLLVGRPHHTRQFCLSVFNCSGRSEGETVRVWGGLRLSPAGKDVNVAAEESALLGAVTLQRLVK